MQQRKENDFLYFLALMKNRISAQQKALDVCGNEGIRNISETKN